MKQYFYSLVLAASLVATPVTSLAATYKLDAAHAEVGFKVSHLGISNVKGAFANVDGTFDFDSSNIEKSKTAVTIKASSINTNNKKRDDHLRSKDFLNVGTYPEISFTSKEIKNVKDKNFTVVGDLSIANVKKEVELDVVFNGEAKDPWGNQRAAFEATTVINRKDFGLTWNKVLETGGLVVGEQVKISIDIEGIKQ